MARFDWKSLIRSIAPTLATALGGPLAGAAVGAVSQAVLGKPDGTEDELSAALATASPDVLLKIKEADAAFKTRMAELGVDLAKARYADVESARDMNIKKGDNTARNLAYIVLGAFLTLLGAEFYVGVSTDLTIDDAVQRTLDISTGVLFAWAAAVKDFYFGSSHGEIANAKSLRRIAEGEAPQA